MSFHGANNFVVNGLTQIDVQLNNNGKRPESKINGFEHLRAAIAEGAFHDSAERFDPPKCHPDTRKAVIECIQSWVDNRSRDTSIMWLQGPAGAGKSAIAQTVAEHYNHKSQLCAAFFFSRTAPKRSTETHLFATIAYQVALAIPPTKLFIIDAIEEDPALFSRSLDVQITKLIVDPLSKAMNKRHDSADTHLIHNYPQLIIIDGLDECANPVMQSAILNAIALVWRRHNLKRRVQVPLCFFILSRPELAIRNAFDTGIIKELSNRLVLDDSFTPSKDIELFIRSKFIDIKQTHSLRPFPDSWPSDHIVETLVDRSSGQFIYASVVMKYISDPRRSPMKRVDVILGIVARGQDRPYAQLDALYTCILDSVDDYVPVSRILGALVYIAQTPSGSHYNEYATYTKSTKFLDSLLLLEDGNTELLTVDLHSVLFFPDLSKIQYLYANSNRFSRDTNLLGSSYAIRFFHASFSDFLTDESRSLEFALNHKLVHADLANCCLKLYNQTMQPGPNDTAAWYYSLDHAFYHLSMAPPTSQLIKTLHESPISKYSSELIKCGYFRQQVASVLEWISNAFDSDDNQFEYVCGILQQCMDSYHLKCLNKYANHARLPTLLALGNFLKVGGISSEETTKRDSAMMSICRRVCAIDDKIIAEYIEVDENALRLFSNKSPQYSEWLSTFLSNPSRCGKYAMREEDCKQAVLQLSELFPSHRPHELATQERLLLDRIFCTFLARMTKSDNTVIKIIRGSLSRNQFGDLPQTQKEIQKYLKKYDGNIITRMAISQKLKRRK